MRSSFLFLALLACLFALGIGVPTASAQPPGCVYDTYVPVYRSYYAPTYYSAGYATPVYSGYAVPTYSSYYYAPAYTSSYYVTPYYSTYTPYYGRVYRGYGRWGY